jgi:hypothetical protein
MQTNVQIKARPLEYCTSTWRRAGCGDTGDANSKGVRERVTADHRPPEQAGGLTSSSHRAPPHPSARRVQPGDGLCLPACGGGDQYTGLDRFGRVVDQRWVPTSSPQNPTDRFRYTYDRDSNRLTRTNAVNTVFSESYGYDSFNELTSFSRGTHSQGWTLDNLGNWKSFTNDQTGPPTENRTHNVQNQIVSIDAGLATPTYDANGNTKSDERNNTYSFDGWNRLAQVVNYSFDMVGRLTADAVTIPSGSQVDGTVTKLGYSNDTGGRPFQIHELPARRHGLQPGAARLQRLGALTNEYQSQ